MRTRNRQVNIRMTEKEYQEIKKKADASKRTFSSFIINASLNKNIAIINELKAFVHQLSKVGTNLNQLTILCHQGKITCIDITETKESIRDIYSALLKISDSKKIRTK